MSSQFTEYPEFMVRREGKVIFSEADFPAVVGFKYGKGGLGTGNAVVGDTDHAYSGPSVAKLTSGNAINDFAEIKRNLCFTNDPSKMAFEWKFIPDVSNNIMEFHIGPRTVAEGIIEGSVRYDADTETWELQTGNQIFTAFSPAISSPLPTKDATAGGPGDFWGWARLVVDLETLTYVSFEAAALGKIEYRDLTGTPLANLGVAIEDVIIIAAEIFSVNAANHDGYVTDWVVSVLD